MPYERVSRRYRFLILRGGSPSGKSNAPCAEAAQTACFDNVNNMRRSLAQANNDFHTLAQLESTDPPTEVREYGLGRLDRATFH